MIEASNFAEPQFRAGLPKKTQTYFLFRIIATKVNDFRSQLTRLIPLITTTAQVFEDLEKIAIAKKQSNDLVKLSGVNICFTRKGFAAVSSQGLTLKMTATNLPFLPSDGHYRSPWRRSL